MSEDDHKALADWRRANAAGVKHKRGWVLPVMEAEYRAVLGWVREFAANNRGHSDRYAEDLRLLEELYWMVEDERTKIKRAVEGECPIGFFKPSWEQAHVLNSWHPDYEPHEAPTGYQICCNFGGKRALKTSATVINTLLWMIPNDPDWVIFEPHVDEWGREVKVLPRFRWDEWKRSNRRIYDPTEPPKMAFESWHGCVDEGHWKEKVCKEYGKWLPDKFVARRGKDREWYVADKWFKVKHGSTVHAKLYGSDQQAWSGKELWLINLDEAPTRDKLDEAVFRTRYLHWSFTPGDPANIGEKSALAREVFDGDYKLPVKAKFLFPKTKFTPGYAIDRELIAQRVALAAQRGEQGRVEVEGGFFDSSPRVFTHFKPEHNILPVDGEVIVRAIRDELLHDELARWPWLRRFKGANILRGFDEGLMHPTACSWMALLDTGEKVLFRELEESDASVQERCERIIAMSGNKRVQLLTGQRLSEKDQMLALRYGAEILGDWQREQKTGQRTPRFVERFVREPVRRTLADSKIFRRDPQYPLDNWTENYTRNGLKFTRPHYLLPEERCDVVNGLFRVDQTRKHLVPGMGGEMSYGAGLYLTNDLVVSRKRIEHFLRGQFTSGPRRGEFTGKPQVTGDDLIDGICYVACERITWIDPSKYDKQEWQKDRMAEAA